MEHLKPHKIKFNRTCKKFTQHRSPYKVYLAAKWNWSDIFIELDELKLSSFSFLADTSNKYGIKYSTLSKKYIKYCDNKILMLEESNNENRGGDNKIFSIEDDKNLFDHIKTNFIDKNRPLTNNIIKQVAIDKFNDCNNEDNKNFKASQGWCTDFKKRWKISTQRIKSSKIASKPPTETDINEFLESFKIISNDVKKKIFLITMK